MIESYEVTLGAGVPSRFAVSGEFFRLLTGSGIKVDFFRRGARAGSANGMNGGFYAKAKAGQPFEEVELLSATAQTVGFIAGEAEAGSANSVAVSGAVDVNVLNVPRVAAQQASLITKAAMAVGTSVVYLVGAQARNFLLLQNQSTGGQDIYVGFGYTPAVGNGLKLSPGDSVTFDAVVPNDDIRAIASAAGGLLFGNMGL